MGTSTGALTAGSLTSTASMESLLLGTSADVTGRYGMTGQPNYYGPMPTWLAATGMDPMKYIQAVSSNNYDPWYVVITNNGDDRVYMGREEITKSRTKTENVGPFMYRPGQSEEDPYGTTRTVSKTGHTDSTLTVQQAMNAPLGWSEKKVAETIKKMNKAGFKVNSFDQMSQVWGQMVQRASAMYAYSEGQNKVTPWDVLTMYGKEAIAAGTI